MADDKKSYQHDGSDKRLDSSAHIDEKPDGEASQEAHPTHDPEHIRKHNDTGKDRMFEGREQHDEHDLKQEKNRLAKDLARHEHTDDHASEVTPSNMHVKKHKE